MVLMTRTVEAEMGLLGFVNNYDQLRPPWHFQCNLQSQDSNHRGGGGGATIWGGGGGARISRSLDVYFQGRTVCMEGDLQL